MRSGLGKLLRKDEEWPFVGCREQGRRKGETEVPGSIAMRKDVCGVESSVESGQVNSEKHWNTAYGREDLGVNRLNQEDIVPERV